ncbi:MAG: carboxymuconolactone decarboxylase family protein [Mycobacterium sp.]
MTNLPATDLRTAGLRVFRELLPGSLPDSDEDVDFSDGFAPDLMDIGLQNVFGTLWTREGLGKRERSLVTLGILIALRATDELHHHFLIARQNGLTDEEIAEVIYHASGYAGFPAANTARSVAAEALTES